MTHSKADKAKDILLSDIRGMITFIKVAGKREVPLYLAEQDITTLYIIRDTIYQIKKIFNYKKLRAEIVHFGYGIKILYINIVVDYNYDLAVDRLDFFDKHHYLPNYQQIGRVIMFDLAWE